MGMMHLRAVSRTLIEKPIYGLAADYPYVQPGNDHYGHPFFSLDSHQLLASSYTEQNKTHY